MKKEDIINHGLLMDTVNMGALINAQANNQVFYGNTKTVVVKKTRRKVTSVRQKSVGKKLAKVNNPKKYR